jgi:hypothetical protein
MAGLELAASAAIVTNRHQTVSADVFGTRGVAHHFLLTLRPQNSGTGSAVFVDIDQVGIAVRTFAESEVPLPP